MTGLFLAAPLLCAIAAIDVRRRLVPDWGVTALGAIGLGAALAAGAGPAHGVTGLACLALGVAAARGGVWGWGDAKLIGAAGLAAGPDRLAVLLVATALIGAGYAGTALALRPFVRARLGRPPPNWPRWLRVELTRLRRAPSVPYALAIAGGLAVALASSG